MAAGCGSSSSAVDGSNPDTTTAAQRTNQVGRAGHYVLRINNHYSVQRYVTRANRICDESWSRIRESLARYEKEQRPNASDGEIFAKASQNIVLSAMQFWYDDISWIGVPKDEGDQFEHMLDSLQLAIYKGHDQNLTSPNQLVPLFEGFNQEARAHGLESCIVLPDSLEARS